MAAEAGRLKIKARRLGVYSMALAKALPSYALFVGSGHRLGRANMHRYCVFRLAGGTYKFGMTSRFEQAYLSWFASEIYSGTGEIVDLGSWLGSTVLSIAEGLMRNRSDVLRKARIHAFDNFRWETWMDSSVASSDLAGKFAPGDSFLGEFQRRTSHLGHLVTVHPGDLTTIGWNGAPIELLVVDAMKSWALARAILTDFYSALVPGVGIVFHQDFAHYYTYWIHLIQYRLREHFEPVCDLPESGATVFRLRSAIPIGALAAAADRESYSAAEIEQAYAYSRGLVDADKRQLVDAAYMTCLAEYGYVAQAERKMRSLGATFSGPAVEFERACEIVRLRAAESRGNNAGHNRGAAKAVIPQAAHSVQLEAR